MKKRLTLIPFFSFLLTSCICNDCGGMYFWPDTIPDWNSDKSFRTVKLPLVNMTEGNYDIKGKEIEIWYVDDSDVPYVNLEDFIHSLDGFFNVDKITVETDPRYGEWYFYFDEAHQIGISCYSDYVWADSYDEFSWYSAVGSTTNYSEHLYGTNDYFKKEAHSEFELGLGNYGFDVLGKDEGCIIPLFAANTLFCTLGGLNVLYNGEKCFATCGEVRNLPEYYACESNKKSESLEMRGAAINSLLLIMDTFYGLKGDMKYDYFKNTLKKSTLDYLWSTGAYDNYVAYKEIIYQQLDELHTRIDLPSYYCDSGVGVSSDDYGEFYSEFYARRATQRELRESLIEDPQNVRFEDDLAIITLDSFTTGAIADIYNEDGTLKEDAWKHDSYRYMHKCMNEITAHPGINKVVLDLSLNGGGNIGAMDRVTGFMTDEKIPVATYDTLSQEYRVDGYYIDVDGDGNYADDAYDEYDWYLLTGINTFSAANLMSSTFKQMGLGKIIGKWSGGGMCSIMSLVLADGTAITISSPYTLRYLSETNGEKEFVSIEQGIKPDINLEYKDFYDSAALLATINSSEAA